MLDLHIADLAHILLRDWQHKSDAYGFLSRMCGFKLYNFKGGLALFNGANPHQAKLLAFPDRIYGNRLFFSAHKFSVASKQVAFDTNSVEESMLTSVSNWTRVNEAQVYFQVSAQFKCI